MGNPQMTPKISIITVVCNNKAGIVKTLESVVAQQGVEFEYIVIDGGSTDGTCEYLEANREHIDIYISEKDGGIYEAMNKGWKIASGEYCLFLNSGDYLYCNNVLEQVMKHVKGHHADVVYGSIWAFDEKQNWVSEFPETVSLQYLFTLFLPHPATFFKRSLLAQLDGYYEQYRLISDWILYIRAFLTGAVFKKIPVTVTAFYMLGSSSVGESSSQEKIRLFQNELSFLKTDFDNAIRLWHYDSSRLVQAASRLSKIKSRFSDR